MKKVKLFYLEGCPYCKNAFKAIDELLAENPAYGAIEIERIEETKNEAEASKHDYYYVPTIFFGEEKLYEASPAQNYDDIKASVREAFDRVIG